MQYLVLASDYDGTLAHDGVVDESTISSLEKARSAGVRLFMVTGREVDDLSRAFSHLELFEWVVAENGALLYEPGRGCEELLAAPAPAQLIEALKTQKIPLSVGRSIVATVEPHEKAVLEAIRRLGLEWHIIFNKGSVMALPSGVNKATGLAAILKKLSISPRQVVAVGDAENDQAFLGMCGYGVAVANALESLKERADFVTQRPRGGGVSELIDRLVSGTLPPAKRREVGVQRP